MAESRTSAFLTYDKYYNPLAADAFNYASGKLSSLVTDATLALEDLDFDSGIFNADPTWQPQPDAATQTAKMVPNVHPLEGIMEEPSSCAVVSWYVRPQPYQAFGDGSSQVYYLKPSPYHFLRDPDQPVFRNGPMELCTGLARALYSRDRHDRMLPALEHPTSAHCVINMMTTYTSLVRERPARVSPEGFKANAHLLAFAMYSCRIWYGKKYHLNEGMTRNHEHNRLSTKEVMEWVATCNSQDLCVSHPMEYFIASLGVCNYVGRESYLYFLQMIWLTGIYLLHQMLFLYSSYPLCKALRMELTHRLKLLFGIANNSQLEVEAFLGLAEAYEACVLEMAGLENRAHSQTLFTPGVTTAPHTSIYKDPKTMFTMLKELVGVEEMSLIPLHRMSQAHCFYYRHGSSLVPRLLSSPDPSIIPSALGHAAYEVDVCKLLHVAKEKQP